MRAAGITALGEPVEIFEVDELALPAAGEVLIDVVAAGIGNWDDLVRIGSWQIGGYGASEVLEYHGDWPALVREITGGGSPKAVNAAPGQAATTLKAVADVGRLATITGDPPRE